MADETTEATEQQPANVVEGQPTEETTDEAADDNEAYWKTQARKWEKLAKQSKAAERELEEIKDGEGGELAEARARAMEAERELEEYRAKVEKSQAARALASQYGVPVELLEFCKTADELEAMAQTYKEKAPRIHAAAPVWPRQQIVGLGEPKPSPQTIFADWAAERFRL